MIDHTNTYEAVDLSVLVDEALKLTLQGDLPARAAATVVDAHFSGAVLSPLSTTDTRELLLTGLNTLLNQRRLSIRTRRPSVEYRLGPEASSEPPVPLPKHYPKSWEQINAERQQRRRTFEAQQREANKELEEQHAIAFDEYAFRRVFRQMEELGKFAASGGSKWLADLDANDLASMKMRYGKYAADARDKEKFFSDLDTVIAASGVTTLRDCPLTVIQQMVEQATSLWKHSPSTDSATRRASTISAARANEEAEHKMGAQS